MVRLLITKSRILWLIIQFFFSNYLIEIISLKGVLRPPSFHLSSSLLQATPLGSVPGSTRGKVGGSLPATPSGVGGGFDAPSAGGHPALGTIPGRRFSEKLEMVPHRESSDFDETEPLGQLTNTQVNERSKIMFLWN